MKNSECEIRISGGKGWVQTFHRDKEGWIQTTNGIDRRCTAEQVLNHVLPMLVEGQHKDRFSLVVEKKK